MSREESQPKADPTPDSEREVEPPTSGGIDHETGSPEPAGDPSSIEGISQIRATLDQLELQIAEYRSMLAAQEADADSQGQQVEEEDSVESPVDEIDEEALGGVAEEIAANAAAYFAKEYGADVAVEQAEPPILSEPETPDDAVETPELETSVTEVIQEEEEDSRAEVEVSDAPRMSAIAIPITVEPEVAEAEVEEVEEDETTQLEEPSVDLPELFSELQSQLDAGLHSTASVSIWVDGETHLDYLSSKAASGVPPDPPPLFRAFSSGKAMAAAVIWRLLDSGTLEVDAPVARYWPEFAQRRKSKVTLRHVLTHTAGLPHDFGRGDVDWGDWGRMSDILASMPLEYEPGKVNHYHSITFGILVAEIAGRATGVDFAELFEREVASPLSLGDTRFVINEEDSETRSRVQSLTTAADYHDLDMPEKMDWLLDNQIMSPGATCVTSSNDLAKLYSAVCNRGVIGDGDDWLTEDAADRVFDVHASAYNIQDMLPARVGQGVWMFDEQPNRTAADIGSSTFGHGGMGTSIAWGDPDHNVAVAIITDTMQEDELNDRRLNRLSAAIRKDLRLPFGSVAEL